MKKNKTLILGYGLSSQRTEAISKSAITLSQFHERIGIPCDIVSIDQLIKSNSLPNALINRNRIINLLEREITTNQYTHIIDVFALPISSLIFTKRIMSRFPQITYFKEVQNDYGSSRHLTSETIIRILGNNHMLFDKTINLFDSCFSRNLYLCNKYQFHYLPTSTTIRPISNRSSARKTRICYLGHPLQKKGISVFPDLFRTIGELRRVVEFNFAFSDIGPKEYVINEFNLAAHKAGVKVNFFGKVNPPEFFRNNDIYLLPIHDQFGAASTPNTVLEAMEAGCVVMTTNIESVQGVLNDQNSILLKDMDASTILKALNIYINKTKLLKKSKLARQVIINRYTNTNYINQLRKIYEKKK